jgi:hypothetical protein
MTALPNAGRSSPRTRPPEAAGGKTPLTVVGRPLSLASDDKHNLARRTIDDGGSLEEEASAE